MAEIEKLRRMQEWLTEHETRLNEYVARIDDLEGRMTDAESMLGLVLPRPIRMFPSPSSSPICKHCGRDIVKGVKRCLGCGHPVRTPKKSSRWVLEMYPLDVLAWRRSLIELAGKPLTPSEYKLVSEYDRYLHRKGYLTSRQIEVLGQIARRHDVELPAIPERVT